MENVCERLIVDDNRPVLQVVKETVVYRISEERTERVVAECPQNRERLVVSEGPQGRPGSVPSLEILAGETISALQPIAVIDDLAYAADSNDLSHCGRVVGISSTAASPGNPVTIKADGSRIQDAFFSFSGGLVYVGPAGSLTETAPTSGFAQGIAVAVASDVLIVQPGPPVRRA